MLLEDFNDLADWASAPWPLRLGGKPLVPPPERWIDELREASAAAAIETMGPL